MIDKQQVKELALAALAEIADEKLFLVGVTVGAGNDIDVVIDSDEYVDIESCIVVSKFIEGRLDREVEDFSLSVYSAGIGMPFVCDRQFKKAAVCGNTVGVVLKSGERIVGVLVGATVLACELDNGSGSVGAIGQIGQIGQVEVEYQEMVAVAGKKRKELVAVKRVIEMADIKSVCQELTIR